MPARNRHHEGDRGQILVIFAGAMFFFVLLAAMVIDLSWYWTSNLRMQRAADSAALAGVIYLPGDLPGAYSTARAEAAKNGYSTATGYTVTPVQDPSSTRRLKVSITGNIGTFFARVAGINSFPARRDSKADFVLPVPMGSPQNYYGVGFYEGRVPTVTSVPGAIGFNRPGSTPSGSWTTPGNADNSDNDSFAISPTTNGATQQWGNFGLDAVPGSAVIDGIRVRFRARITGSGLTVTTCQLRVNLSWDGGASWTTNHARGLQTITTSEVEYTLGAVADLVAWPRSSGTWAPSNFSNANFRVRLTWTKPACAASRTASVDTLEAQVQYHTNTTTYSNQVLSVNDPVVGTALASQGYWGAIFTSGGLRENGDRHGPAYLGGGTGGPSGSANPNYDAGGYDYTIELPGGSGQVRLFDPIFCATGDNGRGGSYGAGDHWTGTPTGTPDRPVSVDYRLYNTQGTLANTSDDGPPVATLSYDPGAWTLGDFSGAFGVPSNQGDANAVDCSTNPAHNAWVSVGAGNLPGGTYRLNVNTSLDADNLNVGAENLFSIWVKSSGNARVYGGGRMAAYTNLDGGLQKFYFAQIEDVHAGKTVQIDLFDPGEASGNAFLRILSPDGDSYDYVTFDWRSDDGRSGTGVTQIQTAINGAAQFNNRLVTISIPLPSTYGDAGLDPPGDITTEDGWWQIEYNVNAGNDTTTWAVSIRGNPVHLVLP